MAMSSPGVVWRSGFPTIGCLLHSSLRGLLVYARRWLSDSRGGSLGCAVDGRRILAVTMLLMTCKSEEEDSGTAALVEEEAVKQAEGFEAVEARAKNDDKFDLSYLDNQVFFWSVRDIFNRDLLNKKACVITSQKIGGNRNSSRSCISRLFALDYICTQGDLALIDFIKEIPCEPRVEVVLIDDAFVERKSMECLFQPNAYLGDEVIDCYINLIKAQKHLKCRSGGRVHIENAFQFNFLKRDGDVEIKTEELYPIEDMTQICSAERRVLLYLDHDMVFIPINIRETHWYLAVIHARNMEIQVLDSLATSQDRKDLTDSIKGLQRQIDMISQRKELKDHRWPNLQVASWPLREIDMGYAKQTDSSSCGLFLLNYIEYWTGDELSDSFT
ncbi:putative ubiquitin-like-specific protease 1B [Zea mays]|uniref:Putative ubiquitin-like-specific protease 1B n=1 Tax=Zea mays TaxID=4577 RepID=A0A3L6DBU0_MAIZE|nr:putative ubiquitin-like-specific protease 1B [Zea mays]